jgi:hypothetical protein
MLIKIKLLALMHMDVIEHDAHLMYPAHWLGRIKP